MGQASASASSGIDQTGDASIYINTSKYGWMIWVVIAVLVAVVLIKRKK